MRVRIGIDVGGTFTDAVAIDDNTYELIGTLKIPTTHNADGGVAEGIVAVIDGIMEKYDINPKDVTFIAHGTTQATNALLEGDVVKVGVIGMGKGMEGMKANTDTQIGDIELAPGKFLYTSHGFVDLSKKEEMNTEIKRLINDGCQVIVASAAFAVDDPSGELELMQRASENGVPATGSHEISKLYGLKIRTRTAAINASILPKMMDTANMTEASVKKAGIQAPLMIMRCDGGVMDINEVRKRPILTMLSGPAAGVAGALMYEKVSNGLFLEVGGTSTDISCVKNGKVMVKYAEVGGHKTYLTSLDVRTVGIAGGSMVRINEKGVQDVGPRSAHIAGYTYSVYADPSEIVDPKIVKIAPTKSDPSDYAIVECANGKRFTITVSCAANILGYVKKENYAYGNKDAAYKAFEPFAKKFGITVEQFAKQIMDKASEKNKPVVEALIKDYDMDLKHIVLVGGGGGSAAIVPYLAEYMGVEYKIAKNAEVISPIGVALAMVRDIVERNIINPTEDDIMRVRKEAEQAAIRAGAAPETIEIQMEVDSGKNIVRAIATAATELRTKNLNAVKPTEEELIKIAAKSMMLEPEKVSIMQSTGNLHIMQGINKVSKLFGILKKNVQNIRVIDDEGIIRIQKGRGIAGKISLKNFEKDLEQLIQNATTYGDAGEELPDVYAFFGKKIVDLSGLISRQQIISIAKLETQGLDNSISIVALACPKG